MEHRKLFRSVGTVSAYTFTNVTANHTIVTGAKILEISGQPESMRIKYLDAAGAPGEGSDPFGERPAAARRPRRA